MEYIHFLIYRYRSNHVFFSSWFFSTKKAGSTPDRLTRDDGASRLGFLHLLQHLRGLLLHWLNHTRENVDDMESNIQPRINKP